MIQEPGSTWIDVQVVEVRRSAGEDPLARHHAVVLQGRGGGPMLPIYMNPPAAVAIACSLQAVDTQRPLTYQLAVDLVHATGSRVAETRITQRVDSTFYAAILVETSEGLVEVDARPGDALNVALSAGAPIRLHADLLDASLKHRGDWEQYPTHAPQLVAEFRRHQADARAFLREDDEEGSS